MRATISLFVRLLIVARMAASYNRQHGGLLQSAA